MGGIRDLTGKRALITGAAGAVGSCVARRLFDHGCELLLVDQRRAELESLAAQLPRDSAGDRPELVVADLSDVDALDRVVEVLAHRPLNVLINNAGLAPGISFAAMDAAQIDRVLAVNLVAAIRLTHRLLPALLRAEQAQIVNVASASGLAAPAGMVAYAASKFGLVGFSEGLRAELHDEGVGVSVVCPAFVKSEIVRNSEDPRGRASRAERRRLERLDQLVKRRGMDPDRVARAVIEAIRHDRARIVLGAPYRMLIALRSVSPRLAHWLNRTNYAWLKRRGLL